VAAEAGRPASARRCRCSPCSSTTWRPTNHIFHPAYDVLYQAEATYYPTLGYNLAGRSRTRATSRRTSGSCCSARR
jgi:hypothetical protein